MNLDEHDGSASAWRKCYEAEKAEVERLTAENSRLRHHFEQARQTMIEMGTESGQTISTSWVKGLAESALVSSQQGPSDA